MTEIVETLGRLMVVLVDIGIVKIEQSVWILEPLEDKAESEGRIRMGKKIKIELPENATNGDMIKTMFPNISIYEHGSTYSVNNEYNFNSTWWNAPYKTESEDKG